MKKINKLCIRYSGKTRVYVKRLLSLTKFIITLKTVIYFLSLREYNSDINNIFYIKGTSQNEVPFFNNIIPGMVLPVLLMDIIHYTVRKKIIGIKISFMGF